MERIGIEKGELGRIYSLKYRMKKGDFEYTFTFKAENPNNPNNPNAEWKPTNINIGREKNDQKIFIILNYDENDSLSNIFSSEDGFRRYAFLMRGVNPGRSILEKDNYSLIRADLKDIYNHHIIGDLFAHDIMCGAVPGAFEYKYDKKTNKFFKPTRDKKRNEHDSLLAIVSQPELVRVVLNLAHAVLRQFKEKMTIQSPEEIKLDDIELSKSDEELLKSWFDIEKRSFEEYGYDMGPKDEEKDTAVTEKDIAKEDASRQIPQSVINEVDSELGKANELNIDKPQGGGRDD